MGFIHAFGVNVDIGFIVFIVAVISAIVISVGIAINNRRHHYDYNNFTEEHDTDFDNSFDDYDEWCHHSPCADHHPSNIYYGIGDN